MNELNEIEQRYGFALPEAYRHMYAASWMDVKGGNYFWLNEAEWMSSEKILNHEPEEYHKPGYVPFARTGGGDEWCWWPSEHPDTVVRCPHDYELGDFYASSFAGFIYWQLLDYARYVPVEDEQEVRQHLRTAASRLSEYLPSSWIETLTITASAPLVQYFLPNGREAGPGLVTEEQYQAIVQRDLAFLLLDQEFKWMTELEDDD